ncbi:MAG: hypothetical protein AAGD07_02500 [Planctomycetota bacterium]
MALWLRLASLSDLVMEGRNAAEVILTLGISFLAARVIDLVSTIASAQSTSIRRLELRIGFGMLFPYPYFRIVRDTERKDPDASNQQASTLLVGPMVQLSVALVLISLSWLCSDRLMPVLCCLALTCTVDALLVGINPFVNSKGNQAVELLTDRTDVRLLVSRYWRESLRTVWLQRNERGDALASLDPLTRAYLVVTVWVRVFLAGAVVMWASQHGLEGGSLLALSLLLLWTWPSFIQELAFGWNALKCEQATRVALAKRLAVLLLSGYFLMSEHGLMGLHRLRSTADHPHDPRASAVATSVRAPASGFVCDFSVVPGQRVMAGEWLGRIRNPDWESERERLQTMLRANDDVSESTEQTDSPMREQLHWKLDSLEQKMERASIRALISGRVSDADLSGIRFAYVEVGTELIRLIPEELAPKNR